MQVIPFGTFTMAEYAGIGPRSKLNINLPAFSALPSTEKRHFIFVFPAILLALTFIWMLIAGLLLLRRQRARAVSEFLE